MRKCRQNDFVFKELRQLFENFVQFYRNIMKLLTFT